jgi:hypothetical protein
MEGCVGDHSQGTFLPHRRAGLALADLGGERVERREGADLAELEDAEPPPAPGLVLAQ